MRRLAHISDLHFGRHDPAVAEALLADLTALAPHVVVVSGDLTQRARRAEFAAARAFLDRLPAPFLVIPGNHDLPLYNLPRRFFNPMKRYERFIARDRQPFINDGELAILGLDTSRAGSWKDGRISREQIQAMDAAFAECAGQFKVLVTHHPLIPAPDEPTQDIAGRSALALAAVEQAAVDLLLSGHYHHSSATDVPVWRGGLSRSVLVVHAGTAISTRQRQEVNAYNIVDLASAEVACSVRRWTAGGFAETARKVYARAGYGWTRLLPAEAP